MNYKKKGIGETGGADDLGSSSKASEARTGFATDFLESIIHFLKAVFDPAKVSGLGLTLFVVTASVALLLGSVNRITAPVIEQKRISMRDEAMNLVLPADRYDKVEGTNLFKAVKDGSLAGFCVSVSPVGYGGPISMMFGVGLEGQVLESIIISHSETPGFGAKAKTESWFLEQLIGADSSISLGNGVDSISGATITSSACVEGARTAVLEVMRYLDGSIADDDPKGDEKK